MRSAGTTSHTTLDLAAGTARHSAVRGGARLAAFVVAVALLVGAAIGHAQGRTEPMRMQVGDTEFVLDAAAGMAPFVSQAADVVEREWEAVIQDLGAPAHETVYISIEREFVDWFERNDVPSRPPEWAAGLAIPSRRVILLAPGNPQWEATLVHEMVHIGVAFASSDHRVPAWFNEGIAVYLAEQWDIEKAGAMLRAGVGGGFLDFRDITDRFPAAQSTADIAYAQSFHFVRYVRQNYGDDVFRRILALVRDGHPWPEAFELVTGTLQTVVMDEWAARTAVRYRWIPVMTGAGIGWTAISVLALMAWRKRRKRFRDRLQEMSERESGLYSEDPDDSTFG